MSKKSQVKEESVAEIKRRSIEGRLKFRKSKDSSYEWYDAFEELMNYVNSRIKEADFQKAIEAVKLKGGERILDFGASMCWASYAFSKMGCDAVALDFDMNDVFGLLAGKKIIENTDFTFRLVAGDCEQMPFKDESFDVVFGSQVLHHAEELNKMVSEAARVTLPGGMVIAIGEVKRGFFQSEEELKKRHKAVAYGVNEHFPSYFQYVSAFKKAGLVDIDVFPPRGWGLWEEAINKADNFLKRLTKLIKRIPLAGRIIRKFYLIFRNDSITIVAKKNKQQI